MQSKRNRLYQALLFRWTPRPEHCSLPAGLGFLITCSLIFLVSPLGLLMWSVCIVAIVSPLYVFVFSIWIKCRSLACTTIDLKRRFNFMLTMGALLGASSTLSMVSVVGLCTPSTHLSYLLGTACTFGASVFWGEVAIMKLRTAQTN